MSSGGQKSHKNKDSEKYKTLQRKIGGFKAYKERIKLIPEALSLKNRVRNWSSSKSDFMTERSF